MKIYFLKNFWTNINKNNCNKLIISNNKEQEVAIFNNKYNNKYQVEIKKQEDCIWEN